MNAWDPSGHKIYATEENIAGFSFYLDKYVQSTKNKSSIGKKKRKFEYEKKSDRIKIGKNTYTAPSHWEKRKRYYKKAIKHIG